VPPDDWRPIPVFATEAAWPAIEARFHYLIGRVIDQRLAAPGQALDGPALRIVPLAVDHGPTAPGAVGFVFAANGQKIVYTGDFMDVVEPFPPEAQGADLLLLQANFFNEPANNKPHHMSLQRGLDYLERFDPRGETVLLHIGTADWVEGDPANGVMKKRRPGDPLTDGAGRPVAVPTNQAAWQQAVDVVRQARHIQRPIRVGHDGLVIDTNQGAAK
jgi:phosphoribosyl 1,2-cyclic phosphate phosphodiesterase